MNRDFASDISDINNSGHHMHEIEKMNNHISVVSYTTQSTTGRTAHVQTLLNGIDTTMVRVENSVAMDDDVTGREQQQLQQQMNDGGDCRYCRCCNGIIQYAWHYVQYAFPFQRVPRTDELVSGGEIESCKMFFARKDRLGHRVCRVFLHGTQLQLRDNIDEFGGSAFETLNLLSQCPAAVSDLAIQLWTITHSYSFTSLTREYFLDRLCVW